MTAEIERLTRLSRSRSVGAWFPLMCGGTATLASIAVESFSGYGGLTPYWAVAAPAVGAASAIFSALRRIQPPDRTSFLAVGLSFVMLFAMAGVQLLVSNGEVDRAGLTPALFVGALIISLGLLYRHSISVITGIVVLVSGVVVMAIFPAHPYTWVALTVGVSAMFGAASSMIAVDR